MSDEEAVIATLTTINQQASVKMLERGAPMYLYVDDVLHEITKAQAREHGVTQIHVCDMLQEKETIVIEV